MKYIFFLLLLITSCAVTELQMQQRLKERMPGYKFIRVDGYKYIGIDSTGNIVGVVDAAYPGIYRIDSTKISKIP